LTVRVVIVCVGEGEDNEGLTGKGNVKTMKGLQGREPGNVMMTRLSALVGS